MGSEPSRPASLGAGGTRRDAHLKLRWQSMDRGREVAFAIGALRKPEQVAAVALALYVEAMGLGRAVSYSRSKDHYHRPRRYRSGLYTYDSVVGAVEQLDRLGLILYDRVRPGRRGWQSSMRATPELIRMIEEAPKGVLQALPPTETIILRDAVRRLLDYRDDRVSDRMRREVQAQNEAILGADLGRIIPFPGSLRRIFNGDFNLGGRFYAEGGSWQTLSKAERHQVTVGGEPVIEIDYSTFHPVLAYAEVGLAPPSEPYDVRGYPRDLVKIAFNILLNSGSRNGARHEISLKPAMATLLTSLDRESGESLDSFRGRLVAHMPDYFKRASGSADRLIGCLIEKHDPIRSLFFSGAGLRLQRRDSDIAEAVMGRMRSMGIVVLPIHDSFLVPASKADILEQVMVDEAAARGAHVNCKRSSYVSVA